MHGDWWKMLLASSHRPGRDAEFYRWRRPLEQEGKAWGWTPMMPVGGCQGVGSGVGRWPLLCGASAGAQRCRWLSMWVTYSLSEQGVWFANRGIREERWAGIHGDLRLVEGWSTCVCGRCQWHGDGRRVGILSPLLEPWGPCFVTACTRTPKAPQGPWPITRWLSQPLSPWPITMQLYPPPSPVPLTRPLSLHSTSLPITKDLLLSHSHWPIIRWLSAVIFFMWPITRKLSPLAFCLPPRATILDPVTLAQALLRPLWDRTWLTLCYGPAFLPQVRNGNWVRLLGTHRSWDLRTLMGPEALPGFYPLIKGAWIPQLLHLRACFEPRALGWASDRLGLGQERGHSEERKGLHTTGSEHQRAWASHLWM